MEPKLMSYITAKYSSKSDMMLSEREWQEVIGKMLPRFKEAGALRQVVTQIWNQEGSFILGNLWDYADEKGLYRLPGAVSRGRGCPFGIHRCIQHHLAVTRGDPSRHHTLINHCRRRQA